MNSKVIIILSVIAVTAVLGKDLPESFQKCKRNDPKIGKCLEKAVNSALRQMRDGLPEYGLLPLDPLAVNSLTINQGGNSAINLKQEFKNIKLLHLTDSVVSKYKLDLEHYRITCEAITPVMEFLGDYTMDGRVLVLPVTGKGKSNITMIGLVTTHELIAEPITKKGEIYMKLKDYKISFTPKRVYMSFTNLFNGDKALGDNMNHFLNENWEIVFNELKSGYEETFGLVFKEVTNKIFTKVPMRKIFLEE